MAEVLLQMEGIQKYFPGVHALDGVHLTLQAGEVHALVGENGAGKSTLMKILTGIYTRDEGVIKLNGVPVEFHSPRDAQEHGISIIHQELNLMRDLTVAENIFIGRENTRGLFLDKKEQNRRARELMESLNLHIDPTTEIKRLTVAKQQMVEIAKALSFDNTRILIMDEPSAPLTETEIEELYKFIRELKAKGVGIIYISHRLEELWQIADVVTVMRDGQYVDTKPTSEVTKEDVINMMVGRVIYEEPKQKSNVPPDAPVILEAKGLVANNVKNVSFELHKGEILGFAGLVGAGRTETVRALFGADRREAGQIFLNGQEVTINTPSDAVRHGIGYLSEDRKAFGIAVGLSVRDNAVMADLDRFSGGLFMDDARIDEAAEEYVRKIAIKTPSIRQFVKNLSGGNQQKIVIAKWLIRNCDILIFDEPTRGIDVGAKSEIYKLMNQLVEQGKSIIMISSDMPELLRMSDRVIVMCEGRKTGELDIAEATQASIMHLATEAMEN